MAKYRSDDINLLLPCFRDKVVELVAAMYHRGYRPIVFDTLRTKAEAVKNFLKGTGTVNSIHLTGAAADLICGEHGWSCQSRGCKFFETLGDEAEALGLTWGGRWPRRDMPHVQGVKLADQNKLRALKTAEERDAFVRQCLSRR